MRSKSFRLAMICDYLGPISVITGRHLLTYVMQPIPILKIFSACVLLAESTGCQACVLLEIAAEMSGFREAQPL